MNLQLYCGYLKMGCTKDCSIMEQKYLEDNTINLKGTKLSQENIGCMKEVIGSSPIKAWKEVNLSDCDVHENIQILHDKYNTVSIKVMALNNNNITDAYAPLVSDMVVKCQVEELWVNGNHGIGENEQFYFMLSSPSTNLKVLHINDIGLSSENAICLFRALQDNGTLKELIATKNNINNCACAVISSTLKRNNCLVKLWIWGNPISGEASILIVESLKGNCYSLLESLGLPYCNERTNTAIKSLQEAVNIARDDNHKVKLVIHHMFS